MRDSTRFIVVVALLSLLVGCAERDEFVGGGTYRVELTGDLQAIVEGGGLKGAALEEFADSIGWVTGDRGSLSENDSGAVLSIHDDVCGGETVSLIARVPAGTVSGCEQARLLSVDVGNDSAFIGLGGERDDQTLGVGQSERGLASIGSDGRFVFSPGLPPASPSEGFECIDASTDFEVDVSWQLDDGTRVTRPAACDG